jgi:hypothetical protein
MSVMSVKFVMSLTDIYDSDGVHDVCDFYAIIDVRDVCDALCASYIREKIILI